MPASSSATSTANGRRSSRAGTSKGILILKLSPELLSQFASPPPPERKDKKRNGSNSVPPKNHNEPTADSPVKVKEPSSPASSSDHQVPPSSVDNASDGASTPAPGTSAADTPRRKGVPGPKPGAKRGLNQSDLNSRARGKPGPKKKPKLDDGSVDAAKLAAAHRLGPKANTGAINAGLRALDRTGTPCRKWQRKTLQLKSFTGTMWQLPSWRAPKPQQVEENGEMKEAVFGLGDSDSKANQSASGVPSEKSHAGDGDLTPAPPNITEPSSPAIAMTA
ncbi:hypothetical protein FE257_011443 [Aspergillus nanangensis]|uniref:INO80 complex, subunit Ies4 n=1 Tax=Aspergillus nanangensis TaxID=2582783 RepID=A0AAD4CH78_ASPNN|nr:hypothetical protein FE257_011443 [Aspergillus nanangensis]